MIALSVAIYVSTTWKAVFEVFRVKNWLVAIVIARNWRRCKDIIKWHLYDGYGKAAFSTILTH